jgi:prepilin peptidase CpaA
MIQIIGIYLIFSMLAVIWLDVTRYIIPNWLVGSVLALYPLVVFMSPVALDWQMALAALGIVFAVGYVFFIMRWMGGGDIKLIIACSLWVGLGHLVDFIFVLSIIGGAFSLALLFLRKAMPHIPNKSGKALPRVLQVGAPVPYGVAIAAAFLLLMWQGQIQGVTFGF